MYYIFLEIKRWFSTQFSLDFTILLQNFMNHFESRKGPLYSEVKTVDRAILQSTFNSIKNENLKFIRDSGFHFNILISCKSYKIKLLNYDLKLIYAIKCCLLSSSQLWQGSLTLFITFFKKHTGCFILFHCSFHKTSIFLLTERKCLRRLSTVSFNFLTNQRILSP